jgi:CspA family cold shock protein
MTKQPRSLRLVVNNEKQPPDGAHDAACRSRRSRFKWFNGQKGYGFIQPDSGGKDVFVHISAVEKAGHDGLAEGAKVSYDVVPNKGKESAENLKIG